MEQPADIAYDQLLNKAKSHKDSCGWIQLQGEQAWLHSFPSNCLSVHWCFQLKWLLEEMLHFQDLC